MTAAFDFDVPPFDTLNAAQQALVRATASLVHFASDDPVLTPEMEPTHAYLLVEGHVQRAAGILPEATYGAGTLFGARALLSARATSTSLALDEVRPGRSRRPRCSRCCPPTRPSAPRCSAKSRVACPRTRRAASSASSCR